VETGIRIIEGMRGHTSGLEVPTFVVDLSHGGGKVPLQTNYLVMQTEEELMLRNYVIDVICQDLERQILDLQNELVAKKREIDSLEEIVMEGLEGL
jgi:L-lysine 2,3-aminomutase